MHFIHRWETIKDTGLTFYEQCRKCGKRRIRSYSGQPIGLPGFGNARHGYQPVDRDWLRTGEFLSDKPRNPPKGPGTTTPVKKDV